jgi:hypothetical protein
MGLCTYRSPLNRYGHSSSSSITGGLHNRVTDLATILAGGNSGTLVIIILVVTFVDYKLSAGIIGQSPSARLGVFGSFVEEGGVAARALLAVLLAAGTSLLAAGTSVLGVIHLVFNHITQWLPASIPIPVDSEIADSDQQNRAEVGQNVSPPYITVYICFRSAAHSPFLEKLRL